MKHGVVSITVVKPSLKKKKKSVLSKYWKISYMAHVITVILFLPGFGESSCAWQYTCILALGTREFSLNSWMKYFDKCTWLSSLHFDTETSSSVSPSLSLSLWEWVLHVIDWMAPMCHVCEMSWRKEVSSDTLSVLSAGKVRGITRCVCVCVCVCMLPF